MDCSECQDRVRSATTEIYKRLKDYRRAGMVDDQVFVTVAVLLKKIENQVASKCDTSN